MPTLYIIQLYSKSSNGYKPEEKTKVVTVIGGTELIQFIALLDIFHHNDLKKGMVSSYSSNHPDSIHPILLIDLVQFILFFLLSWCKSSFLQMHIVPNSQRGKEYRSCHPIQQRRPLPSLLSVSFFYAIPPSATNCLTIILYNQKMSSKTVRVLSSSPESIMTCNIFLR